MVGRHRRHVVVADVELERKAERSGIILTTFSLKQKKVLCTCNGPDKMRMVDQQDESGPLIESKIVFVIHPSEPPLLTIDGDNRVNDTQVPRLPT